MIESAWNELKQRMLSQSALYVLWGSVTSAEDLTERYLTAKGERHLLDQRRHLSESEKDRLENARASAQQAFEYLLWARGESGDPMLRDIVVGYCTAFENALKSVALAFEVAHFHERQKGTVFIPAQDFSSLRRRVQKAWKNCSNFPDGSTAEQFFKAEILAKNPQPKRWVFKSVDDEGPPPVVSSGAGPGLKYKIDAIQWLRKNSSKANWLTVGTAFKIRHKIVHQNGYIDERLEIADKSLFEGDDIQLDAAIVRRVHAAFLSLMDPIRPREPDNDL